MFGEASHLGRDNEFRALRLWTLNKPEDDP